MKWIFIVVTLIMCYVLITNYFQADQTEKKIQREHVIKKIDAQSDNKPTKLPI
jgi:regulatory protein YycI of two-component signal transduction system YycFG